MLKSCKFLCGTCYLLAFLLSAHVCAAQFTDDFSDGDFTSNPTWSGDAVKFTVSNGKLQSNAGVLASSTDYYLSLPSSKATSAQWEFFVNLKFSTSGTNFLDVYLISDAANLTSATVNGYFVRIGDTQDDISLYKIVSGTSTKMIDGADGVVNSSSDNPLKIKVVRDPSNLWTLEFIDGLTGDYQAGGSVSESTFLTSGFFGVKIRQSSASSPANNHFIDDVYVGDIIVDTEPPIVNSVTPTSASTLNVLFNEKVELTSAQTLTNYIVNNGVSQPLTAILQADEKTVQLAFAQSFPNATNSQLTVTGVKDLLNNSITSTNHDFFFFQPVAAESKDVIITEIFADPSPVVGLPEAEFIEIYNRSNKVFDLQNWKITDGSSIGLLPTHLIFPKEYLILASTSSAGQFSSFGNVLGVPNFPTLNNSSDSLLLKDNLNAQIDNVNYDDGWYRDDDKKQGGYTLELIDPANPCGENENWIASESAQGGTPGTQNSVFANKPDLVGPKLLSAIPTSETTLVLKFNEKLEETPPSETNFTITPTVSISQAVFADASLKSFQLTLSTGLQAGTTYSISAQNIFDCNGNELQDEFDTAVFGLPQEADSLDVLVNEILFNPRPTGVDFVEVYNNSSKFINLKNWTVANYENGVVSNAKVITTEDFLLHPNQYIAFTENKNIVIGEYASSAEANLFETDLPGFNDDEGTVVLTDENGNVIDFLSYTDDYHSVFIDEDEGVSLERISFTVPTNEKDNWKSASSTVGFATPGDVNSNVRAEQAIGKVTVSPEAFEPITGQPSFTQIQYNFEQGGFVANIKILDFQGREIKQLANNATLGTEGFFRWDGDTDNGSKARTGYYIVWVEVFNASGQVDTFRKRVVVTSRL